MTTIIHAAVEGELDEYVVERLVHHIGAQLGTVHGKSGKAYLKEKITGFNNAAQYTPWLVLVDLDHDAECAPPFCKRWIPQPSPLLCFRVAVRSIESWLLADTETMANFLHVSQSRVPGDPESLDDPKTAMVNLARSSRRRDIRDDMVPRAESGRKIGPAYTSRLIEFVNRYWRPDIAARQADSLARTIRDLRRLVERTA